MPPPPPPTAFWNADSWKFLGNRQLLLPLLHKVVKGVRKGFKNPEKNIVPFDWETRFFPQTPPSGVFFSLTLLSKFSKIPYRAAVANRRGLKLWEPMPGCPGIQAFTRNQHRFEKQISEKVAAVWRWATNEPEVGPENLQKIQRGRKSKAADLRIDSKWMKRKLIWSTQGYLFSKHYFLMWFL